MSTMLHNFDIDGPSRQEDSLEEKNTMDGNLTIAEKRILKDFEEDPILMEYVRLTDKKRGEKERMEERDSSLRVHAQFYKELKAKAERISKEE